MLRGFELKGGRVNEGELKRGLVTGGLEFKGVNGCIILALQRVMNSSTGARWGSASSPTRGVTAWWTVPTVVTRSTAVSEQTTTRDVTGHWASPGRGSTHEHRASVLLKAYSTHPKHSKHLMIQISCTFRHKTFNHSLSKDVRTV